MLKAGGRILIVSCAAAAVAAACSVAFAGQKPEKVPPGTSIPEATCFWEGPISTKRPSTRGYDGRNFNFPEESATYWMARFSLPEGAELALHGRFPHGRYMSLNTYTDGAPIDTLSDPKIEPDPGSANPFVAGARRDGRKRDFSVTVSSAPPPAADAREPNTIYGNQSESAPIELFLRVYEPDPGRDLTGGAGLPEPELVLGDGRLGKRRGGLHPGQRSQPGDSRRADRGGDLGDGPPGPGMRSEHQPRLRPASLGALLQRRLRVPRRHLGLHRGGASSKALRWSRPSAGGFYSNRDSAYIYAHLSRNFAPLVVVEARLPRFPQTSRRPKRMPSGDMRFWSLCTGESRVTLRTPDCLSDRQVLKQSGRNYTVVVSKAADRPENATRRCGVAWLDWGERGDGVGDPDYAALVMRNMLVDPGFGQAIQNVARPTEEETVMGPYFPRTAYATREEFEARGCG